MLLKEINDGCMLMAVFQLWRSRTIKVNADKCVDITGKAFDYGLL
jgi:hypothetical protein